LALSSVFGALAFVGIVYYFLVAQNKKNALAAADAASSKV
jgi:cbb3-type cytochrome oxidase subunit 3